MPTTPRLAFPYPSENEQPFYDTFSDMVNSIDSTLYANREDRHIITACTAVPAFDSGTGILSWAAAIKILNAITGTVWTVPAGQISVQDGQLVYVNLVRAPSTSADVNPVAASRVPADDNSLAIALRVGNTVYWRDGLRSGTSGDIPAGAQGSVVVWNNAAALTTVTPVAGTSVLLGKNLAVAAGVEFKALKDWMPAGAQNAIFTRNGAGELATIPLLMKIFANTAALPSAALVPATEAIVDTGAGTRHRYYSDGATWTDLGMDQTFSKVLFGNTVTAGLGGPYAVTNGHKLDIEVDGTPHVYVIGLTTAAHTASEIAADILSQIAAVQADDDGTGKLRLGANASVKVTGTTAVSDSAVFGFDTLKHIAYRRASGTLLFTTTASFPAVDQIGVVITYAPGDGTYRYMSSTGAAWVEIGRIGGLVASATAATIKSAVGPFIVSPFTPPNVGIAVNGHPAETMTLTSGVAIINGGTPGSVNAVGLTLTIQVNGGAPQSVIFTGAALSLVAIVAEINFAIAGVTATQPNGAGGIAITGLSYGNAQSLQASGNATNAGKLNITNTIQYGTGNVGDANAVIATEIATACSGFLYATVSASGGRVVVTSKDTGVTEHIAIDTPVAPAAALWWDRTDTWGTGDTGVRVESDTSAVQNVSTVGGSFTFAVDGGAPQSWVIAHGTAGRSLGVVGFAYPVNGNFTATIDGVVHTGATGICNVEATLIGAINGILAGSALASSVAGAIKVTSISNGTGSTVAVSAAGIGATLGFPGTVTPGTGTFVTYSAVPGTEISTKFNLQGFTGVTSDAINSRFRMIGSSALGASSSIYIDPASAYKFGIRSSGSYTTYYGSSKTLGEALDSGFTPLSSYFSDDFQASDVVSTKWDNIAAAFISYVVDTAKPTGVLKFVTPDPADSARLNSNGTRLTNFGQRGTFRTYVRLTKANTDFVIRFGVGDGNGSITFVGFKYTAAGDATHWQGGGSTNSYGRLFPTAGTLHNGWMELRVDIDPQARTVAGSLGGTASIYFNRKLIDSVILPSIVGAQVVLHAETMASGGLTAECDFIETRFDRSA